MNPSARPDRLRKASRAAVRLVLPLFLSGCIYLTQPIAVYQPLTGLYEPAVVDPAAPNFTDVSLTVRCLPSRDLSKRATSDLCDKVSALFENQGATVYTVEGTAPVDDSFGADPIDEEEAEAAQVPRTDLVLELRSRTLSEHVDRLSMGAFVSTFTIYPMETDFVFAQEVTVRGGDGVLLSRRSLEGRVIERTGYATWWYARIADKLARDPEHVPTADVARTELSADLYQQLSQIVYNAKLQWRVLQEAQASRVGG